MTIVAHFEIPYVQFLKEDGSLLSSLPEELKANSERLQGLYRTMVETRSFDKKAITLQRTGKLGTYASTYGQEAIATAIGAVMRKEDVLVPYYRDYAAQFQRGVKMEDILSYWGGDERGNQYQDNLEDLPIAVPIASQCLHAAGVGFAFKYRQQPRVAVVCIGDGGTSEGDFYEAINVAGAWKLPVVFIINNNRWAISVPLHQQTSVQTLAQKAIAAGFSGIQVDGNDVLACVDVIENAVKRAREGGGPTLIEALTYRLCDHTTADDARRYQPKEEVDAAQSKEPIARFKNYLTTNGLWDQSQDQALIASVNEKVENAVHAYLNRPAQPITSIFDYHYATLPTELIEQRAIAQEEVCHA
ncbi:MAG: pyruvate dehydrogenase (acetyl-transferring) E1 component subunit alpha [Legionella sp.]|nr:pyruvate dehydrogenase (acetyl-transferring) E1 component subunit alpha [Legionella sp.]